MCATSATTSAACPAHSGDVVQCPDLPPGATCSAFVGNFLHQAYAETKTVVPVPTCVAIGPVCPGDCGGNQSCNARVTEAEDADSTNNIVGVCIDLTAAGSPCTVGYGELPQIDLRCSELPFLCSSCPALSLISHVSMSSCLPQYWLTSRAFRLLFVPQGIVEWFYLQDQHAHACTLANNRNTMKPVIWLFYSWNRDIHRSWCCRPLQWRVNLCWLLLFFWILPVGKARRDVLKRIT